MPDFSANLLGLPNTTADSLKLALEGKTDSRIHGWLREQVQEGDRINMQDPSYDRMGVAQSYVQGDQVRGPAVSGSTAGTGLGGPALPYLSGIVLNESRKATQAHVSALTDLKSAFTYKNSNPAYQYQGDILRQYVIGWWITHFADLALADGVKYSLVCGTGDLALEWDPHLNTQGGDNHLSARDPRDTLPFRPGQHFSPQYWQGVTLREEHTVNALRALDPLRPWLYKPSSDSLLSSLMGRFKSMVQRVVSPAADTLAGLHAGSHSQIARSGGVVVYRTYLNDPTRNMTDTPIAMGKPGSNWAYVVQPGAALYPRKRLIVWTDEGIVSDGPNPYWHGMVPISRLRLWSLPWLFLGLSLFHDLLPVQDGINELARDVLQGIRKWLDPTVVFDRNAVSESFMRTYDPRQSGKKVKTSGMGVEGFKNLEGPDPAVLQLGFEACKFLINKYHDLSGTANLEALLQLRQAPAADTIEKFWQALTPELRQEGRMMEASLRDIGEMVKSNFFQFVDRKRRFTTFGEPALALEEFDVDPETLVPALTPGMAGYTPDLDANLSRDVRAQTFSRLFTFQVRPYSLLAIHSQEKQMMDFQLARLGYLDFWSLHETLETSNVGTPPAIPLPPLRPIDPQEVLGLAQQAAATGDPQLMALAAKYTLDPMTGQLLEIRVPMTITERLIAQQILGIGMTENPAGRKASGGASPKPESKDGGSRTTMTESRHSGDSSNPAADSPRMD